MEVGACRHRSFVGPPNRYDIQAAKQFNLLTFLGLRQNHFLLDIGCGSLRAGRLFIPYLFPGRYFGIEPHEWLVKEGIRKELGEEAVRIKRPTFSNVENFDCAVFGRPFDFILAQSVFSHAAEGQIRSCLRTVKQAMKPSSIFVANFLIGKRSYRGDTWRYPGCIRYTLAHMTSMIKEASLFCQLIDWPFSADAFTLLGLRGMMGSQQIMPQWMVITPQVMANQITPQVMAKLRR